MSDSSQGESADSVVFYDNIYTIKLSSINFIVENRQLSSLSAVWPSQSKDFRQVTKLVTRAWSACYQRQISESMESPLVIVFLLSVHWSFWASNSTVRATQNFALVAWSDICVRRVTVESLGLHKQRATEIQSLQQESSITWWKALLS